MTEEHILTFFIFLFGACIGSFLNVCIVRMPLDKSIAFPSSHCVHCQKPINWYDNLPLLSYVLLGGKCRACGKGFSIRYFFVELLTACSFVFFYKYFGLTAVLGPYLFMLGCFIIATFVDLEHRIIPDQVSVGGLGVGLLLSAFIPALHDLDTLQLASGRVVMWGIIAVSAVLVMVEYLILKEPVEHEDWQFFGMIALAMLVEAGLYLMFPYLDARAPQAFAHVRSFDAALIGFLVGGGSIYLMGTVGDILFRKESMGGGDVKLMAMMGAFLGWKLVLMTFFIAPFFGAVWGIAEKIRTKDSAIAYGPFLVLGALISLFKGEAIIEWIMHGYGM